MDKLEEGINMIDYRKPWTVQELYDKITEKITTAAIESTSNMRAKEQKISQETRDLINKKERLKTNNNKLVKKRIKKDLLQHKHKFVKLIIEKSGSTKK